MKSSLGIPRRRNIRRRQFNGKPIENTKRVERVLDLIKYLNGWRTIRQIANHLGIHEKSVNRYLNLLVQLGFEVLVSQGKHYEYKIVNTAGFFILDKWDQVT